MNINIGDTGSLVKFIQCILIEYYSSTVRLSGIYDRYTHEAMINFMDTSNIYDMSVVDDEFYENYDPLSGFNKFFISELSNDSIKFVSKSLIDNPILSSSMSTRRSSLCEFFEKFGWKINEFNCYNPPYHFTVVKNNKLFDSIPKEDLKCMINVFDKKFYYHKILSYNTAEHKGTIEKNNVSISSRVNNYKLAIIDCNPNETYYITTNDIRDVKLVVGSCPVKKKKLLSNFAQDIVDDSVLKIEEFEFVNTFGLIEYTTSSSAQSLVIQVPEFPYYSDDYYGEEDPLIKITDLLIIEGKLEDDVIESIPYPEFSTNKWYVHEKLLSFLLKYGITSKSRLEDIDYIQKLVNKVDPYNYVFNLNHKNVSIFDSTLREVIKKVQLGDQERSYIRISFNLNGSNFKPYGYIITLKDVNDSNNTYELIPDKNNNGILYTKVKLGVYSVIHDSTIEENPEYNGISLSNQNIEIIKYHTTSLIINLTEVENDNPVNSVEFSQVLYPDYKGISFALGYVDKDVEEYYVLESDKIDNGELVVV